MMMDNIAHRFPATEEQKSRPHLSSLEEYRELYRKSLDDPDAFWGEVASRFYWRTPVPQKGILKYNTDVRNGEIFIEVFKGATTNICYNALDRNVQNGHGEQVAYFWEGNDPRDNDKITYSELLKRVCRFANVLKSKGVKKGDLVAIYMPMIPELVVAMFACARIGAIHSVVFAGYSSKSLSDRILDGNIKVVVTADGFFRGQKMIDLKRIVDNTVEICEQKNLHISAIIVVQHQRNLNSTKKSLIQVNGSHHGQTNGIANSIVDGYNVDESWNPDINFWWHEEMQRASDVCEPTWVDAEHTLFTLYTSGSTGKPKGCVHTTGGYMIHSAVSFKYVFDFHPGDIFFSTGDIGWLTGHTYTVYGSLLNAATCILHEGTPTYPDANRYWQIVEKYGVTHFYTAPTVIRTLMRYDDAYVTKFDRSSLKVLASAGEPLNRDAWLWYHQVIGESRCPVLDTYWQTESGAQLLTPMPFCTTLKPGSVCLPFFGVEPAIVDNDGNEINGCGKGNLVFKRPWLAIMRTIYGNHDRFQKEYFSKFPGYYNTGDGALRDEDGYYWITGRVDDTLNVSGHLLSTTEVESCLMGHQRVAEVAVVSRPHPIKGECLYCFVVLKEGFEFDDHIVQELSKKVENEMGSFARPECFHHASALPKTRSGKTVRRILRKIAANDRDIGDVSTLMDEAVVYDLFDSKKYLNQKNTHQNEKV